MLCEEFLSQESSMTDQPTTTPEGATSSQAPTMTLPEPPAPPPPRRDPLPNRRGGWWRAVGITAIAIALLVGGVFAGLAMDDGLLVAGTDAATAPDEAAADQAADTLPPSDEPAAEVAELLNPSVVQLESAFGLGSGVIYDESGLILTAAHVVENAEQVTVRLSDGTRLEGEVIGADSASDVAVVGFEPGDVDIQAAELAVDEELQVGQLAIAIGSPFGLEGTVTVGYISAVDRAVTSPAGDTQPMIQTDAAINPGNSGGALADRQGRVIGINDIIFSRSGGNEGVGFAIPVTRAMQVAERLVSGEAIESGFLGVSGQDTLEGRGGALIESVESGSAAEAAGIEAGDLVVAVDGSTIEGIEDLAGQVRSRHAGDTVEVTVVRDGEEQTVTVTLGERPVELNG
jgi:putative serine protease PepD